MNNSHLIETAAVATAATRRAKWQRELARAITSVPELLIAVGLDAAGTGLAAQATAGFPLRVPRGYVGRMRRNDPDDPLLRQVLPLAAEATPTPGYVADPVGDLPSMRERGLLQKYRGRALMITTGACAVHCRYCFRRNFPYHDATATPHHLDAALARVAADPGITEVILSGGDPLSLADKRLAELFARIGRIGHVERIRIHSRYPVVLPERVDDGLCETLQLAPRPVVFVIHCNHANEIDDYVGAALSRLRARTSMLLNQSVLLRGVNDSAQALAELSARLFDAGVTPYYLHQLDPVAGAAHFAVADEAARRIVAELAAGTAGYLVPRLVREIPGHPSKRPL